MNEDFLRYCKMFTIDSPIQVIWHVKYIDVRSICLELSKLSLAPWGALLRFLWPHFAIILHWHHYDHKNSSYCQWRSGDGSGGESRWTREKGLESDSCATNCWVGNDNWGPSWAWMLHFQLLLKKKKTKAIQIATCLSIGWVLIDKEITKCILCVILLACNYYFNFKVAYKLSCHI